ncbi:SDR family oxidoreductase [Humibacter soli]
MTALKDATVLITGANGGLGGNLVEAALVRGAAKVYAAARAEKPWPDERVIPIHLDLSDPASIDRAVANAGDTTILVNNAAIFPRGDILSSDWDELTTVIRTNLTGPVHLTRGLAGALRAAHGSLVNVNSVLSWYAVGHAHSVSKAALWMATNALRLEFAADDVHVLGVYPAAMDTPMQPAADRSGMLDPAQVAAAIYDAVDRNEDELIIGELALKVHSALSAPVTALYPQLAGRSS